MKKAFKFSFLILLAFLLFSCKKDKVSSDYLGGETNIDLTKVGVVTSLYASLGTFNFPTVEAVVTQNDNGIVTYKIKGDIDLTGRPDSAFIQTLIDKLIGGDYLKIDSAGLLNISFKLRITSEGYQVISSKNGLPKTIIRYEDPAGTGYSFNNVYSSTPITGTITEKTGLDDWPMGFMLIKTSKVEFTYPEEFPMMKKAILRANHRFGIVYLQVIFKNGQTAEMSAIPNF